jgi:hypothetical protein
MEKKDKLFNPIGFLNEFCQKTNTDCPVFNIIKREGPSHSPNFNVECIFKDIKYYGNGLSIKKAKNDAALNAIELSGIKNEQKENDKPSFKIVEYDNIEGIWGGDKNEIKIMFRKKEADGSNQQFKTFIFEKIAEIDDK